MTFGEPLYYVNNLFLTQSTALNVCQKAHNVSAAWTLNQPQLTHPPALPPLPSLQASDDSS